MWVTNGWVTIALALDLAAAVLAQDTLRLETGYFSGISCPTGLKVRVSEAVFGDTGGRSSCELPIQDVDTDYYARVMSECDGQQSCATLDVPVDGKMWCPGTIFVADSIDYVQITYTCEEAIFTVRREQGYFFNAICPTGHVVRVSEAVFGDTGGRSTCQLPVQDVDTDYYARVMSECDGQQSCATLDVPADGEMWCPGSFFTADPIDYVQITYTCEQVLTTTVRPTRTSPSPVVARILPDTGDVLGNAPEEDPGTPAAFVTEGATTTGLIAATELDEISVTGWEDWGTPAAVTTEASIVVATVSQTDVPPQPLRATTEGVPTVVATAGSPAAVATDNPVVITEEHTYGFEVEVLTSAAASAPETATPEPCRRDHCSELDPITEADPLATTGAAAAEVTTETTRPEIVTVAVDTTTAEDVVTVTQTAVIDTVATTVPVDPCVTHAVIDARARHFTSPLPSEESQQLCDNSLSGWVVFDLDGDKAEIPETCIKHETCGTAATFHLQLPDGQAMPVALSESVEAHVCTATLVGTKVNDCCGVRTPVTVHRCEGFFVYKMTPLDNKTCPAAVCVKRPEEVIPYEYLADPPPTTTQPPVTTTVSTTAEQTTLPATVSTTQAITQQPTATEVSTKKTFDLPIRGYDSLTDAQKASIVTIEFKYPKEELDQGFEKLDIAFRTLIAAKLCNMPPKPTSPPIVETTTPEAEPTTEKVTTEAVPTTEAKAMPTTEAKVMPTTQEAVATTQAATRPSSTTTSTVAPVVEEVIEEVREPPQGGVAPPAPVDQGPDVADIDPDGGGLGPHRKRRAAGDVSTMAAEAAEAATTAQAGEAVTDASQGGHTSPTQGGQDVRATTVGTEQATAARTEAAAATPVEQTTSAPVEQATTAQAEKATKAQGVQATTAQGVKATTSRSVQTTAQDQEATPARDREATTALDREATTARDQEEAAPPCLTKDDVHYVAPTPRVVHNILQLSIFVEKMEKEEDEATTISDMPGRKKREAQTGGGPIDQSELLRALQDLNKTKELETETDLELVTFYPGTAKEVEPAAQQSIWEVHLGLFIVVIILIALCIIVIIIGILCIKCRDGEKDDRTRMTEEGGKKYLMVMENPIPDEEILKGEAPMMECGNPAYTPNGQHVSKYDEDNGWVVPMDQVPEKVRPEFENTKL